MKSKLILIFCMTLFGTISLFVRGIPLPSSAIACLRAMVGTLFLLGVLLCRRQKPDWTAIRRRWKPLLLCGACMGANWILLFEAYRHTTVAVATLCYYLSAVFVVLASPLALGERLTPFKTGCVLAALGGMVLVSGVLDASAAFSPVGIACGLGAAVLYAVIVLINKRLTDISGFDVTVVQLLSAAVALLPYVLLTEDVRSFSLTPGQLGLLLTVCILHTGIAYALYFSAIRHIPAQTVALFSYLDPVVALLLSIFVLGEPMTVLGAVGAVIVLAAMLLSEQPHSNERMISCDHS